MFWWRSLLYWTFSSKCLRFRVNVINKIFQIFRGCSAIDIAVIHVPKYKFLNDNEFIDNKLCYYLKPIDLVAASFYGQQKIHKTEFSIRPIVSYSGSPLYNHNKYIANTLKAYIKDQNSNATIFATFSNFIRNVPIKDDKIMVSFWRQTLVQEHSYYVKHNQVFY